MNDTTAHARAECPRCGYDQSGFLREGADAWPLQSRCAECGLDIRWGDYFRSTHRLPRWWIEHAPWRRIPIALPLTIAVSLVGAPLWLRLEMTHRIRWGRLASIFIAVVLIACLVSVVSVLPQMVSMLRSSGPVAPLGVRFPVTYFEDGKERTVTATIEPTRLIDWLGAFAPVLYEPWSNQPLVLAGWFNGPDQRWLDRRAPPPPGPAPIVRIRVPIGYCPYSPATLWQQSLQFTPSRGLFAILATTVSVCTFAVLPFARRRAKVRFAHLVRAWFYLMIGPFWLLAWMAPTSITRLDFRGAIIAAVLLTVWWWFAADRYLHMQRPWAVALSVASIGALAGLAGVLV